MSAAIPRVMMPLDITAAMLHSCSIAEPAAGETAWVSGGTYAIGDKRIRTQTHRVYKAITAHTGSTVAPEDDPINWFDDSPTQRWAALDLTESTVSSATTSMNYVFRPGFFSSVIVRGARGGTISIVVRDAPGGNIITDYSADLVGPFYDIYDYFWGPDRYNTKHLVDGILPFPDAELTITITAATGADVSIATIQIGTLVPLIVSGNIGGTEFGADVKPVNFDWADIKKDGSWKVVPGRKATDISFRALLHIDDAGYAVSVIQSLRGPTAVVGCSLSRYDALTAFGIIKVSLVFEGPLHARISIDVTGLS